MTITYMKLADSSLTYMKLADPSLEHVAYIVKTSIHLNNNLVNNSHSMRRTTCAILPSPGCAKYRHPIKQQTLTQTVSWCGSAQIHNEFMHIVLMETNQYVKTLNILRLPGKQNRKYFIQPTVNKYYKPHCIKAHMSKTLQRNYQQENHSFNYCTSTVGCNPFPISSVCLFGCSVACRLYWRTFTQSI